MFTQERVSRQLPKPTAFGAAIVESSGGKQVAQTGALLPQPIVVQVNDEQGTAVAGALVEFAPHLKSLSIPPTALPIPADRSPRTCRSGEWQAATKSPPQPPTNRKRRSRLKIEEIALGYQQTLGHRLNDQYCERCHNPESTRRARLELRQPRCEAAPIYRGRHSEQDKRCRSYCHHHPRRTGS